MTYIVSGGALNSTHSLTQCLNQMHIGSESSSRSSPSFIRRCLDTLLDWWLLTHHQRLPKKPCSAETRTLLVSRTQTNFGDRAVSAGRYFSKSYCTGMLN